MSVIKNKKKLVKRADKHRKVSGRIRQGFGYMRPDGSRIADPVELPENANELTFGVCAIGCLATPTDPKKIRKFWKKIMEEDHNASGEDGMSQEYALDSLEEKFGITRNLAFIAESIFEGLEKNGIDPIDWPYDFANALPEGVNIEDEDILRLSEEFYDGYDYSEGDLAYKYPNLAQVDLESGYQINKDAAPKAREEFFDWIKTEFPS